MSYWKSFGLGVFAAAGLLGETTGSAHAQCNFLSAFCATEWSGGSVINLGGLSGSMSSQALGINAAGQVVGYSVPAPEPSTWAMMLLGFAGLGFAGYRRAKAGAAV